jgi:N,N'-diacetyllegionaminate synthase
VGDPAVTYTYRSMGQTITEPMLEMFRRYEFDAGEWREILGFARKCGAEFFATPQNPSDLAFILSVGDMPAIKVGSDDLTNLELLDDFARKGKPLIISAGMSYLPEIEDAVQTVTAAGNPDLVILHCVSSYPAETGEINLRKIPALRETFGVPVGFSDHTIGPRAAMGAVALGACMVEKHVTLDRNLPGPDHWFSAEPEEIRELVEHIRFMEEALGSPALEPTEKELGMRRIARRSIVASRDIGEGEVIGREMVAFRRPGTGLPPKCLDRVLRRRAARPIRENEPITPDALR